MIPQQVATLIQHGIAGAICLLIFIILTRIGKNQDAQDSILNKFSDEELDPHDPEYGSEFRVYYGSDHPNFNKSTTYKRKKGQNK